MKISHFAHDVRMSRRWKKRQGLRASYRPPIPPRAGGPPFFDGFDQDRLLRAELKRARKALKAQAVFDGVSAKQRAA